jgi:NTP pyrophosphatase (non-canonical NTP hydrolase)
MSLNGLRDEIHKNARVHGWHDEERSFGEIISLCHSELSEALEEYRKGKNYDEIYYTCDGDDKCPADWCMFENKNKCPIKKPEGIPIELVDCIIRILDFCGHAGIDIEEAIRIKHNYNLTRPYRHGGKII